MSTESSRQYTFVDDKNSGVPITASRMDAEFDNVITKLNQKVLIKSSAPSGPIAGMLWYDSSNKLLKQYRNSEWVVLAIHVGTSEMSTPQEGDAWYDTDNNILKVYNGSTWDTLATTTDVSDAVDINAKTEKETLEADDLFLIEDSADGNAKKKVKYSNVYPFAYTHYDSGWFAVTTNTSYTKTHNLGTTKVLISIYISDTSDGSGKIAMGQGELTVDGAGNRNQCGIRTLTTSTVVLRTGAARLANTNDADGNSWTPTSGYARIIMLALD